MSWKVLYVKPRNEKKVAELLSRLGIVVYCPLVTEVRQWSDRKQKVQVPLLSSYVFVQIEEINRELVFQVSGVIRYLFWLGKPAVVRDNEIELMQEWLVGENVKADVQGLQPGDKMKISTGPFKDKKGIVQEISKNRVQLLLPDLEMKITLSRS
jgi:transcriptional antiterminator RfaH